MAFAGWSQVAANLGATLAEAGPYLNDGQRDSLHALGERIAVHGMVIADEVGMGKTRIAVALARAVVEAGGRVAILIPSTLGFQWREELRSGGIPDVPDVVRSLSSFLSGWSEHIGSKAWFDRSVILVSHGFVNWRLGATTRRWRYELLPLLAGLAHHERLGAYPYGFKKKEAEADCETSAAARSIAARCTVSREAIVRANFEALGEAEVWRAANLGVNYEQGGESRRLLQLAVGLGLGAFDLVVVDEAHKSRREDAGLSRLLESTLLPTRVSRRLCMTATPVELDPGDWIQALTRVGVDVATRERIRGTIVLYGDAVRRVRLGWRSSAAARDGYVAAARAFEDALKPYVLRRDKRSDAAVARFRAASSGDGPDDYRRQHDITITPTSLELDWRRAVCAAEALSFVASGHDDPVAQRLRLTFANGHGIATRLGALAASEEDAARQPGDPAVETAADEEAEAAPASPTEAKRIARSAWWLGVIDRVARKEAALYDHPTLLAAVAAIEAYDAKREKVLVFGRFTRPMRALVEILNARAMLRALEAGTPWPQARIRDDEMAAVAAAHRQLGRQELFDASLTNVRLARQYSRIERRREVLRGKLLDLILAGLPDVERAARALAEAARVGSDGGLAVLAAAIEQLLGPETESADMRDPDGANAFSAVAVADAFLQLLAALRERGEGDLDGDESLDSDEASELWRTLAARLDEEYGIERGRFTRLMNGATSLPTRRTLQLAFNRAESNPRVLVAQSLVGREGLNLHPVCRVVVLLHPEWNPGIVEQQVGRVDRVGSRWSQLLDQALASHSSDLPRIEIRPVLFDGTYDAHNWAVLNERWDDLRAQLHGVVVPHRLRNGCTIDELGEIQRLDAAAPSFEPRHRPAGGG